MERRSHPRSRDLLRDVRQQFERWRKSRRRGTRIPDALWRAAVEAAREDGVSKASRALRLDYYSLKKRLESNREVSESEPTAKRGFLEIPLFASAPECVLEMEGAQGARLRVELKGSAAAHCETLVRVLWSVAQ